jgi:hypothetical protein
VTDDGAIVVANAERPTFEYLVLPEASSGRLGELGRVGWELVGQGGPSEAPVLYLKREGPDFRERVTLDQRRRYYESLGLDLREDSNPDSP